MPELLKQSTAVTVKIGPFVDDTDFKTAETALTISQADVRLSKNAGNMAQKNESTSCTHDELGVYDCPLDATDTGTLGRLRLDVAESGALHVWHEYVIVPANVYDALVAGSDKLDTNAAEYAGVTTDSTDIALIAAPSNFASLAVTAGGAVTAGTVSDKTGYRLSATGVDDVLDEVVEGSYTFRQYLRLFASSLLAKLSGAATTTVTIRDTGDSKDRVVATVDADGNRSAVTLDAS